ncbi:MAG: tRNA (adenosine(37)-N6)-threonylcarbamoyltransferase complex dimerization subunit type 1 TsaB [bacterium]|nr:tRNA (adenosine(37)-N6)-threonylcarbamoyltransferase complex dimerization subunit type 1 TsaB [bacterium]
MKILGIETSTSIGSVAIVSSNSLLATYTCQDRLTHASWLMEAIDKKVLLDAGLDINDINGISVSIGPGSFTGIRIGMAVGKGLAQSLNIPIVGISTLDGLAYNLVYTKDLICPIIDAKRKEVYTALYRGQRGEGGRERLIRLTDYLVITPSELLSMIKEKVIFLGDGVEIYGPLIKGILRDRASIIKDYLPSAENIAYLGLKEIQNGKGGDLFSISPLYIRPPDAEIKMG